MKVPFPTFLGILDTVTMLKQKQIKTFKLLNCAFIRAPKVEIHVMGLLGIYICEFLNFCPAYFPILKTGLNY